MVEIEDLSSEELVPPFLMTLGMTALGTIFAFVPLTMVVVRGPTGVSISSLVVLGAFGLFGGWAAFRSGRDALEIYAGIRRKYDGEGSPFLPSGLTGGSKPSPIRALLSPDRSLLALVGANLVPLVGVLLLGWSPHSIVLVYWAETAVVGVLAVPKLLVVLSSRDPEAYPSGVPIRSEHSGTSHVDMGFSDRTNHLIDVASQTLGTVFIVVLTVGVSGVFAVALPELTPMASLGGLPGPLVVVPVAALSVQHLVSFRREYLRSESLPGANRGLAALVVRLFVLLATMIVGALLTLLFRTGLVVVAVLVAGKTLLDVGVFVHENGLPGEPDGATAAGTDA